MTDKLIFFYTFNENDEDFYPIHMNTMFNFMDCTSLQIGNHETRLITFSLNQKDIQVYQRKFYHGFNMLITRDSKEEVCGQNLSLHKCFLISDDDYFESFCADTFDKKVKVKVPIEESNTSDPIEIITIKIS